MKAEAKDEKIGIWYYFLSLPVSFLFAISGFSNIAILLNFYAMIAMVMIGV